MLPNLKIGADSSNLSSLKGTRCCKTSDSCFSVSLSLPSSLPFMENLGCYLKHLAEVIGFIALILKYLAPTQNSLHFKQYLRFLMLPKLTCWENIGRLRSSAGTAFLLPSFKWLLYAYLDAHLS